MPPPASTHPLGIVAQLSHSTTLIRCQNDKGEVSSGTGFAFGLFKNEKGFIPTLVTNKHVIAGAKIGQIILTARRQDGSPDFGNNIPISLTDFEGRWLLHPDETIDLAIMPMGDVLNDLKNKNKEPFLVFLDQSIIPDDNSNSNLSDLEDVLIVGYPDGISDTKNNVPIMRRGITATPPKLDFDGEPKFLVDASIFPGSSGSPVFIYNSGSYSNVDGGLVIGSRIILIGVVYAVAQHMVTGELRLIPAPTQSRPVALSNIPNNLGVCIKSDKLIDFEALLVDRHLVPLPTGYKVRSRTNR